MATNLRTKMPAVTAFIDDLRATFGTDTINAAIRAGMNGQPTFHAHENGIEVGARMVEDPARTVRLDKMIIRPVQEEKRIRK